MVEERFHDVQMKKGRQIFVANFGRHRPTEKLIFLSMLLALVYHISSHVLQIKYKISNLLFC
jgi:hypothetical protein